MCLGLKLLDVSQCRYGKATQRPVRNEFALIDEIKLSPQMMLPNALAPSGGGCDELLIRTWPRVSHEVAICHHLPFVNARLNQVPLRTR